MAVLRRACTNCTASKRKCVVRLPTCTRCAQRGLQCVYHLEHLGAPNNLYGDIHRFEAGLPVYGHCLLKSVTLCGSAADPAIGKAGQSHTLDLIRRGYQAVPNMLREGIPATFVHPNLRPHNGSSNYMAPFVARGESGVIFDEFQRLLQLDFKTLLIHQALTALQALVVYVGFFSLSSSRAEKKAAEESLTTLSNWTESMLESVQCRSLFHQSIWQEWIFGESVRRTIFMSYGLSMALHCFKYGYCSNWLFLESLPFDKRPGLWMAQNPQAWIASAGVTTGADVGHALSSLHEFAENRGGADQGLCGDEILLLAVTNHNGFERFPVQTP